MDRNFLCARLLVIFGSFYNKAKVARSGYEYLWMSFQALFDFSIAVIRIEGLTSKIRPWADIRLSAVTDRIRHKWEYRFLIFYSSSPALRLTHLGDSRPWLIWHNLMTLAEDGWVFIQYVICWMCLDPLWSPASQGVFIWSLVNYTQKQTFKKPAFRGRKQPEAELW